MHLRLEQTWRDQLEYEEDIRNADEARKAINLVRPSETDPGLPAVQRLPPNQLLLERREGTPSLNLSEDEGDNQC